MRLPWHALPAGWTDEAFEAQRRKHHSREFLFSTVMELIAVACLGLRP